MAGSYGNENLMFISKCIFITTDGTSDPGVTLDKETKAISIYATADAWVNIGAGTPVAAAPSEKVNSNGSFFVPAGWGPDVPVPVGTDATPILVAAIQATAAGNVYIYQRKDG